MRKFKVGIIGCGAIGTALAKVLIKDRKLNFRATLVAVADKNPAQAEKFLRYIGKKLPVVSASEVIRRSDFVIEAAHPSISSLVAELALKNNKYVLIMSVGGLLKFPFQKLHDLIARTSGRLYCPSGALAGIDALLAAQVGGLKRVRLVTTKPPQALMGAPYFKTHAFPSFRAGEEKKLVFRGSAFVASRAFPQNINVAAILSLAGLGPRKTEVEIWASKVAGTNRHEVCIEGDFGIIRTTTDNFPAPDNPKTSYLAILSAAATLRKAFTTLRLGT
ncbi:MAG TPA: DUF108 domain-containing protein [Candidatus Omnitrophota bacterium]|nr:DUF108 domain-containing protein [Candidatus Omnitrophota bacterium]HPS37372.1 DUF108 domain-containing protein [Candidatus Omnitrophota bacterium]